MELTDDVVFPQYWGDKLSLTFFPTIDSILIFISPKEDIKLLLEIITSIKVSPSEMKEWTPFKLHSFPPLKE